MHLSRRDSMKLLGGFLVAAESFRVAWADAQIVDMGNRVQYQVYGHENDMIRFLINNSEIARDEIKDVTANVPGYKWSGSVVIVPVIHGREKDQVYCYAVIGNRVLRSPLWRDTHPGVLNLGGVNWSGDNTVEIPGDGSSGTMTFSDSHWHCTADGDSVIEQDERWL